MTDDARTTAAPETQLRPRDIQARIRAGESVEDVAASAGTTVAKLMPFAGPVLGEREHMAERAQGGSLRRRGEPAGSVRTLGQAVAAHLGTFYLDPDETIAWDSFRRPDGRWQIIGDYAIEARTGRAELIFDVPGNYVSLVNDDARWLVGELVEAAPAAKAHDDLHQARQRRLSVIEEVGLGVEPPIEHPDDVVIDRAPAAEAPAAEADVPARTERPAPAASAQPESKPEKPAAASRKKRSSVPSWDEIMFGGGK